MVAVDINGSWIRAKRVSYTEFAPYECFVTFMNDEVERYDAQDVTVLKAGEYEEHDLAN